MLCRYGLAQQYLPLFSSILNSLNSEKKFTLQHVPLCRVHYFLLRAPAKVYVIEPTISFLAS
jgi:hypothetical protein